MKKSLFCCIFALIQLFALSQTTRKVIIDADTGNEVDDLYAVVRGLIEPSWEVIGLNATQWQVSQWAVDNTMENSYRLNQVLLSYLRLNEKVMANRGSEARLFDWGNKSQTSAASEFIADQALNSGGKITIITLGALTNVASALLDHPEISDKVVVYWLGTNYDFENGTMKNIDFNSVMDIQAVDVVLNSKVELHIIPGNVASKMTFNWQETENRLRNKHDLANFLLDRWYNHLDGGRRERIIWDLALVQAVIHPEWATEVVIKTSRESGEREIWMYKDIDADKMREDFFVTTLNYLEKI